MTLHDRKDLKTVTSITTIVVISATGFVKKFVFTFKKKKKKPTMITYSKQNPGIRKIKDPFHISYPTAITSTVYCCSLMYCPIP